jgi:hypothetical protein
VDRDRLADPAIVGPLPGLAPLMDAATRQALARYAADAAAGALANRLSSRELAELAERGVERHLLDLAEPPRPYYPTLPDWIEQWLLPVYRRSITGHARAWCPEWWRHDEAVARLEALWRAWEHLRLDAAIGMSLWFRDHADHHLSVLLDADGPFKGCDAKHSERPLEPLPHEPPPAGIFASDDLPPAAPTGAAAAHPPPNPATGRMRRREPGR